MTDIKFYLEHETPGMMKLGIDTGNCIATVMGINNSIEDKETNEMYQVGYFASNQIPDSECEKGFVKWKYLRSNCKRIGEKAAKRMHPNLFKTLKEHGH